MNPKHQPTEQEAVEENSALTQLYKDIDEAYPVRMIDALAPHPDNTEVKVDINEKLRKLIKIGTKHGFITGLAQRDREREELLEALREIADSNGDDLDGMNSRNIARRVLNKYSN